MEFALALVLLVIELVLAAAIIVVICIIREIWNRTPPPDRHKLMADWHEFLKLGNLITKLEILERIWKLFCSVLKYTVVAVVVILLIVTVVVLRPYGLRRISSF
jgi:hypothetical protein